MPADVAPLSPWDPVDLLPGIGPKLSEALSGHGVERIVDLLLHAPRRWEDRTQLVALDTIDEADLWVLVRGVVTVKSARRVRRRMTIVAGAVDDGSASLAVVWFNQPWIERRLKDAGEPTLYGAVRRGRDGSLQLVNPEVNEVEAGGDERIVPVYGRLGPFGGRRLRRLVASSMQAIDGCDDPIPAELCRRLELPDLRSALSGLHDPEVPGDEDARRRLVEDLNRRRTAGHRRLAFDELLAFSCAVADYRQRRRLQQAPRCRVDEGVDAVAGRTLPFLLTAAQSRVTAEIAADLEGPHPMARLIQGDVGSGKTAVAVLAMTMVLDSGHQAALLAPTELLAEQHLRTLERFFERTPHRVRLLTQSVSAAEQRAVRAGLADGSVRLVVGTHALIQESVRFDDLGLAVVDEQHRFGVAQRQSLLDKGAAPHLLVMTATPIPRSLALTVYGDLDLSVIDELPPGRRPVTTVLRSPAAKPKLYDFLRRELAAGGRAYVVVPMIESSEEIDAPSLDEQLVELRAELPGFSVGVLHGRMPAADRDRVAVGFREGALQALLATTVVEVGVDVAEASVMVIEGADRFGLSQLHQLRGRVGRGSRRSWCVLVARDDISEEARRRLEVLCGSSDGFDIAEADLELRGPGELTGRRQWGPAQFRFADLVRHRTLVGAAREAADRLAATGELAGVLEGLSRYHPIEAELPAG